MADIRDIHSKMLAEAVFLAAGMGGFYGSPL
jgi:hypothetical protein